MASVVLKKNKTKKPSTREELETLGKEQLIDRILQLEAHNLQLKNILNKQNYGENQKSIVDDRKGKRFDFSKYHKRHILLKFYYLGWDYQGFTTQEETAKTIEHHLFAALTKTCLIKSRESSNYHRCGRTDKGVSAFSQVISIDVRSSLNPENQGDLANELRYCKLLNRLLPTDIRCISWSPAPDEFSARFDCKRRTYKYFFPRGNLNVQNMDKAVKYTIGTHDFRNICKMDVANGVVSFERLIMDAGITLCYKDPAIAENSGYDMCQLTIIGRAFLWHQIRCIMGILLLVGQGKEEPEIVLELLDVLKNPRKPQYSLAHEAPLNLFHCAYETTDWYVDREELLEVVRTLQQDWTLNFVRSTMIRAMLEDLESSLKDETDTRFQSDCLLQGVRPKSYQPLMDRTTCESLESRIEHYVKKRRLELQRDEPTETV